MKLLRKIGGVVLIIVGFAALITPFTPGAWLMFVGFELIGVRLTFWNTIQKRIDACRGIHRNDTKTRDTEH